jgi:transcriptional/translational regulatory protein YebC/TACO1
MAVKEGGPNLKPILDLAVIQNSKAVNIKENVERHATDKDTANYKEALFEGYAPHGIAILVETATDNNNRTVANVRSYFNKCNGTMGTQGSVELCLTILVILEFQQTESILELELELIDLVLKKFLKTKTAY